MTCGLLIGSSIVELLSDTKVLTEAAKRATAAQLETLNKRVPEGTLGRADIMDDAQWRRLHVNPGVSYKDEETVE